MEKACQDAVKESTKTILKLISLSLYENKEKISKSKSEKEIYKILVEDIELDVRGGGGLEEEVITKKRASTAVAKNSRKKNLTLEQFLSYYNNPETSKIPICCYMSGRIPTKGLICASELTETEKTNNKLFIDNGEYDKYKCNSCAKNQKNLLEEKIKSLTKNPLTKDYIQEGYNVVSKEKDEKQTTKDEDSLSVIKIEGITGYLFSADEKFPGLVYKGDDESLECIGLLLKDNKPVIFEAGCTLDSDWKKNISVKLDDDEKKYLLSIDVSFIPEKIVDEKRRTRRTMLDDDN